jgi:Uma2 family endonuclease
MSTLPNSFITPEQYLELERKAEFKSEYYNGEMFAMSGGSRWHGRIAFHLSSLIDQHLTDKQCEGYGSDMRVLTPSGLYTYPDLAVVCGEPQFLDSELDTLTNPTLLVEILSPSTESYDLGKKAGMYRTIPTLKELLFIAQHRYQVQLQRRQADGTWSLQETDGLDKTVELASIAYTLPLVELYRPVVRHRG